MNIKLSKTLTLDREAVFLVISDYFQSKGYDVANIDYLFDEDNLKFQGVNINMFDEEIKYEQNI